MANICNICNLKPVAFRRKVCNNCRYKKYKVLHPYIPHGEIGQPNKNREQLIEHIKSRTITDDNSCWIWQGTLVNGYGQISWGNLKFYVHRLMAHFFLGYDLESNEIICHQKRCNDKRCVNPEHLYIGTHYDNRHDRIDLNNLAEKRV